MDTTNVSNTRLWFYKVIIILLAISTIFVATAVVLSVWPYKTVDVVEPIEITNKPIEAGTVAEYVVEQCRHTDATAIVTRRLISRSDRELYIPLGGNTSESPAGCYTFRPPAILIPLDTPPGLYEIEFKLEFEVNPIRTIEKRVLSEVFEVTAPSIQSKMR